MAATLKACRLFHHLKFAARQNQLFKVAIYGATIFKWEALMRPICLSSAVWKKMSESHWKAKLTPEQYHVCRQKGTEPPWSGEYVDTKKDGTYQCICCGADLFRSTTKFDSGSGWPSFYAAITSEDETVNQEKDVKLSVNHQIDHSHGMTRVEVTCRKCDAHLGHMFKDGPPPTGMRYCINSVALTFEPQDIN